MKDGTLGHKDCCGAKPDTDTPPCPLWASSLSRRRSVKDAQLDAP